MRKVPKKISNIYLKPWQEIVGLFEHTFTGSIDTVVTLRVKDKICSLCLPRSRTTFEKFQSLPIHSHVAIFRTDDPKEPIHVRVIESTDK